MKTLEFSAPTLPETIHLVGIGGIGLSAIARVLFAWGHRVQGSDLRESDITRGLNELGIPTFVGQRAEQIAGVDLVVMSSAVPEDNPELVAARAAGIPIIKRHQLLGEMLKGKISIAVAGTHGKTTTSAMCATVLEHLGKSPTFIVGGILQEFGANAAAGSGPHFVIEADEYDRTFLGLHPDVTIVTNIEMDHPDCYRDLADMEDAFRVFLENKRPGGAIIACSDSPSVNRVLEQLAIPTEIRTFGRGAQADYRLERCAEHCTVLHDGRVWAQFEQAVAGGHNALNATAVLVALDSLGIDPAAAAKEIGSFGGVQRRMEKKGQVAGITFYDDYAHHPTEIRATLAAVREKFPDRRIWAVFQPHTYSRTETLWDAFCCCFGNADELVIIPVFAARLKEHETVTSEALAASIKNPKAHYADSMDAAREYLRMNVQSGDLVITLGAGDGYKIGEDLIVEMGQAEK